MVRALAEPHRALRDGLEPGGWLHLDVSFGCAGDMLTAALLDLGVEERVVREALADAGLGRIGPVVEPGARGGLRGLGLTFVSAAGPLESTAPPRTARSRPPRDQRRARPPRLAARHDAEAAEVTLETPVDDDDLIETRAETEAARPPRDLVTRCLAGEAVTCAELERFLREARLSPLCAALARKALRRMTAALEQTRGLAKADLSLPGPAALDVLCDLVGFSAALATLTPGRVTTSRIPVSPAPVREAHAGGLERAPLQPGPSAWTLAILEGLPLVEKDLDFPPTTPTGAALLWAVAHQSGPRGAHVTERAGHGLGARVVPGYANATRALYGPLPEVESREGTEARAGLVYALAFGAHLDRVGLEDALTRQGARLLEARPTPEGGWRVDAAGPDEAALVDALLTAGAEELLLHEATRVAPGAREVSVPLAGPSGAVHVRARAWSVRGELRFLAPVWEDLLEASRRLGIPPDAVRREVQSAWRRQARGEDQGDP